MAAYKVNCCSCGTQDTVARKDARVCPPCRWYKVLTYARKRLRVRKCKACAAPFAPTAQKDNLCASCAHHKGELGTCIICHRDTVTLLHRIPACWDCAKDVKRSHAVVGALVSGRKSRRSANRERLAGIVAGHIPAIEDIAHV